MRAIASWVGRALCGPTGVPSAARLSYFVFVLMGAAWLSYDLVSAAVSLKKSGITPEWVMAFGIYASSTTAGYIGGKVAGRPGGVPRLSGALPVPEPGGAS